MTTTSTRPRLKQRTRQRPAAVDEHLAIPLRQRPVATFHQHENGRWLVLELFERGHGASEPFALRDQHGELRLTIGQLEHLALVAAPAALRRYRQQENALLAGQLDEDPPQAPRDRRIVASWAAHTHAHPAASPNTPASSQPKASA